MAEITPSYGEYSSGMAKTPWRAASSGRSCRFSATAASLAMGLASLCLSSRALRERSSSANRANRTAERGLRRSLVVSRYRFNGWITVSINLNNCPASFCVILPSMEVVTDCRPARSLNAGKRKAIREPKGGS